MAERSRRTPVPSQKVKEGTGAQPGAHCELREAAPSVSSDGFEALAHEHARQICAVSGEEQPDHVDGEDSDVEQVPAPPPAKRARRKSKKWPAAADLMLATKGKRGSCCSPVLLFVCCG